MSEITWELGKTYNWRDAFKTPILDWAKPLLPLFNLPPNIVTHLPLLTSVNQQIDTELTQGYRWARENQHLGVLVRDKYGFIDKTGKIVIEPQFDQVHYFSEGLASISTGKYRRKCSGYIDKTGEVVIPAQFDIAASFCSGIASVWIDSQEGYINRKGEYIWEPTN
ncbi:MAG: WG repeat-containing protein [Spirulinaceae cyanobacterium]